VLQTTSGAELLHNNQNNEKKVQRTGFVVVAVSALALTGCGGVNQYLADRSETTELYRAAETITGADTDTLAGVAAIDGPARQRHCV
jgi:hypothetical protein